MTVDNTIKLLLYTAEFSRFQKSNPHMIFHQSGYEQMMLSESQKLWIVFLKSISSAKQEILFSLF
jgi:hypothetical protein